MPIKKITASTNGVLSGQFRIVGTRLVAGTAATTVILYDNATAQSGDEIVKLSANTVDGVDTENWEQISAPTTSNGVSVTLDQGAGANAVLYIYYV
ncbi:MAG: hypothetical protein LRZ94_00805 [Candidatus Pacebacteria bacterium]|nr:hypothetical protein [Candidatus Paceibacterota bacterium]